MLSLRPCRSVDAAAAQLIVREAGGAVAFGDLALERGRPRPRCPLPDRRRRRRAGPGDRPHRPVTSAASGFKNSVFAKNVCSLHSRTPQAGNPHTEGIHLHGNADQRQQKQRHSAESESAKAPTKAPASEKNQARTVAETAVDLPVGAVLAVTDRVAELVEPFTGRSAAEKQLKSYRTELRRTGQAHRASRHHRPPQGDHRGPQDPQPGRARGPQASAHGRDDAEAQPQRARAARPQSDRRALRVQGRRPGHISSRRCVQSTRRSAAPYCWSAASVPYAPAVSRLARRASRLVPGRRP